MQLSDTAINGSYPGRSVEVADRFVHEDLVWLPEAQSPAEVEPDGSDQERTRLEAAIAAAKARAAAAKRRAADRDAEIQAILKAELAASLESLTDMERRHDEALAEIREAAHTEVARILAEARQQLTSRRGANSATQDEAGHAQ